jgi:thiol:disulfide interchange protein DsbD
MLGVWMALALGAAFYLLGVLRIGYGAPDFPATPARKVWAALFAAVALYCAYGLTGRPLNEWLVAFLPPSEYVYSASDKTNAVAQGDGLEWLEDLDAAKAKAKAEGKPLFIAFTGYTCTNCRWMEKNIFPEAEVKAEFEKFVRVRLYTDGGANQEKYQQYQEKTFGDVALPLYGILTPDGKPIAKSAGITKPAAKFAEFLRKGREIQTASAAN